MTSGWINGVKEWYTDCEVYEHEQLGRIAQRIGGQVYHSGGGIFGVLVDRGDSQIFFGFADDVLGWDITDNSGDVVGYGFSELTIDRTNAVVDRCVQVMKEVTA